MSIYIVIDKLIKYINIVVDKRFQIMFKKD